MPDVTLMSLPFAAGTTIEAYPRRSELMMPDMPPPSTDPVASAVVGSDRTASFTALPAGSYWAIGLLAGRYQYVSFFAQQGFVPV